LLFLIIEAQKQSSTHSVKLRGTYL
jgi:hypothetical protein